MADDLIANSSATTRSPLQKQPACTEDQVSTNAEKAFGSSVKMVNVKKGITHPKRLKCSIFKVKICGHILWSTENSPVPLTKTKLV